MNDFLELCCFYPLLIVVILLEISLSLSGIKEAIKDSKTNVFEFYEMEENMAVAYATLIAAGKKEFSKVPARIKDEVKQILIDLDLEYLIEE